MSTRWTGRVVMGIISGLIGINIGSLGGPLYLKLLFIGLLCIAVGIVGVNILDQICPLDKKSVDD